MADTYSVGTINDAAVAAGAAGTLLAQMRRLTTDIGALLASGIGANTELPAAAALADDTANPTVPAVASHLMVFDGTTWDRARAVSASTDGSGVAGVSPMLFSVAQGNVYGRQVGARDLGDGNNAPFVAAAGLVAFNGSNWDRVRDTAGIDGGAATGALAVTQMLRGGATTFNAWGNTNAMVDTDNGSRMATVGPSLYNGTNWDRRRNNVEANLITAAGLTTSQTSSDVLNHNARGVVIYTSVATNPAGAQTLTINLQMKDEAGNDEYLTIATTGAVYGAGTTGLEVITLCPGAAETAAVSNHVAQSLCLPRSWRVQVVHSGAGAWTYKTSYSYVQ